MLVPGALTSGKAAQLSSIPSVDDLHEILTEQTGGDVHRARGAPLDHKFAANTLGKAIVHARVFASLTRRIGVEAGELVAIVWKGSMLVDENGERGKADGLT
jgi:hypothetical protein